MLHDLHAIPGLTRVAALSHGDPEAGDAIVQGDNLAVLEAVAPQLEGQVRCVYIDPPYNNQERYTHYTDTGPHRVWLEGLEHRLAALWPLLRPDGSLWISIDDGELHYLKVAADRLFGRENFVTTIAWQHRTSRENRKVFSNNHEYLLVWAREPERFRQKRNPLPLPPSVRTRYRNPDLDPRGPWQSVTANAQAGHGTATQHYTITAPSGIEHRPPPGRCWALTQERMQAEIEAGNVWFGREGRGVPRLKRFQSQAGAGITPHTLWTADEVGTTATAKKQLLAMFPSAPPFDTPKPEPLIERVLHIASNPGELVLDAYLGSGTTAAVAHRMGRRYLGIERGDHAATICAERLRQAVEAHGGGVGFWRAQPT